MDSKNSKEAQLSQSYLTGMECLIEVVQKLSLARSLSEVAEIVRHAARELTGADGATFVLMEHGNCYYVDEDAIGPLWKGKRFPLNSCISGWAMLNRTHVSIEDIYQDDRIPHEAYRPTFVKSLVMVPIRAAQPIGAIGNYWSTHHVVTDTEVRLLKNLAASTSVALENIQLLGDLQKSLEESTYAKEQLQRQLLLRDELASVVAHELKTPLTSLSIQIQMIQKMLSGEDVNPHLKELKRFMDVSRRQVRNFSALVDNLIDVSCIRLGIFQFHFEEGVELRPLVSKIIEYYKPIIQSQIQVNVPEGILGHWDAVKVERLIINLLGNALKYGEGKPVTLTAEVSEDKVKIFVQDQGMGILKEDQLRVFDRFERALSVQHFGGMGLGLYVAKKIIEGHAGKIELESEKGVGSTFTVELPLSRPV